MSLEKLAKTVKFLKEEMEESDIFGVYEDDVKVLLETCHLLLNSPSLVEDKNDNPQMIGISGSVEKCFNSGWNVCNEANRIARVRWLSEKFSNLKEVIERCCTHSNDSGDIYDAGDIEKAIRQRFERVEL